MGTERVAYGYYVPILVTMRVIAKGTLRNFWERHPAAEQPLKAWYALMRHREFRSPNELKAEFGTVSLLADGHACFNVGGNKYRLVVHIRYDLGIIFVKRAVTHEEYDALNAAGTLIERRKDD
jgi:mRNA interferase HigB